MPRPHLAEITLDPDQIGMRGPADEQKATLARAPEISRATVFQYLKV